MTSPPGHGATNETTEGAREAVRTVVGYVNIALRHRWLVIGLPILAGVISLALTLTRSRTYTARSTFMTQGGSRPPASGLAAQLGVSIQSSGDPTLSPEFYADLLTSRPILERAVRASYATTDDSATRQTLSEYYGDESLAISIVRGGIVTAITARTGVVTLTVRSWSPPMAMQVSQELLRQLDDFNKQRRRSRVSAERQFTEARLAEAARQLRAVEDSAQEFYSRNRDFDKSPELRFREERMVREVVRRQQLYSTLSQALEQSKIDEVRDTPVITVLEDPIRPRLGDSRHTVDRALLSIALAFLAAFGLAFVRTRLSGTRADEIDELSELQALGREFRGELRDPVGTIKRLFS